MQRHQAPGSGMKVVKGVPVAYAPAVAIDIGDVRHVYASGVTAVEYGSDEPDRFIGEGDMRAQIEQIMRNMQDQLASVGGSLSDIVRVRVYVVGDLTHEDFKAIHEVRSSYFEKDTYPASTLVIVKRLVRPEALIEIDSDAVIKI